MRICWVSLSQSFFIHFLSLSAIIRNVFRREKVGIPLNKNLVYLQLKLLHNYRSMTPGRVLFRSRCSTKLFCLHDVFFWEINFMLPVGAKENQEKKKHFCWVDIVCFFPSFVSLVRDSLKSLSSCALWVCDRMNGKESNWTKEVCSDRHTAHTLCVCLSL